MLHNKRWDLKSRWSLKIQKSSGGIHLLEHEVMVDSSQSDIVLIAKFVHLLSLRYTSRPGLKNGRLVSLILKCKQRRSCLKSLAREGLPKKFRRYFNNAIVSPKDVPSISSSPNSLEDVSIAPAITLPNAVLPEAGCLNTNITTAPSELTVTSSAAETKAWLRARRFQAYEATFASYAASDILCLSRDDLIQICGLTDGIRLYNALHSRAPRPKLSLYFACKSGQGLWRPIYLESLTSQALALKIIAAFGLPSDRFRFLTLLGPQGIHVLVTDDVVANLKDNSMFLIEQIKESNTDCYKLLLKPSFKQ